MFIGKVEPTLDFLWSLKKVKKTFGFLEESTTNIILETMSDMIVISLVSLKQKSEKT